MLRSFPSWLLSSPCRAREPGYQFGEPPVWPIRLRSTSAVVEPIGFTALAPVAVVLVVNRSW